MSKAKPIPYRFKRGKASAFEYDALVYHGDALIFTGSFRYKARSRLTSAEMAVLNAIKAAIQNLNQEAEV